MTPERRAAETRRKSAERQRRREAGYKRVECWLSPEDWYRLSAYRDGPNFGSAVTKLLDLAEQSQ